MVLRNIHLKALDDLGSNTLPLVAASDGMVSGPLPGLLDGTVGALNITIVLADN